MSAPTASSGLRISLNINRISGPYGGGNQFAHHLERFLCARGHAVHRELVPRLDVILVVCAKYDAVTASYDLDAIREYKALHPRTVVVHRVNDSDEARAATRGINEAMLEANRLADFSVFVSSYIRELHLRHGFDPAKPYRVVPNGADEAVFNPSAGQAWQLGQRLRIVTHHWSCNYLKGYDIYERLDELLDRPPYRDWFEFTCIGRPPLGVEFRNTRVVPTLHGAELAAEIKRHHAYVTAARHEAGGHHYVEAMQCGLPVLYLKSGSLPEYCGPYGIGFTLVTFEEKLRDMRVQYPALRQAALQYSHTGTRMAEQYEQVFRALVAERLSRPPAGPGTAARLLHAARAVRRRLGSIRRAIGREIGGL